MIKERLSFTKTQILDYLIVISPPPEIKSIVSELKRDVGKILGRSYKYKNSVPHLTICKTVLTTDREERIVSEWNSMIEEQGSFTLQVNEIKIFESSGTIYLDTDFPDSLKEIQRKFYILNKELRISKKGYHLISKPHITIGSGLEKEELELIKKLLSGININREFEVQSLVGLRAELTDKSYHKSRIFNLKTK